MKRALINTELIKEQIQEKLIQQYQKTKFFNTTDITVKVSVDDIVKEYLETKQIEDPAIYILTDAYLKMRMLVDECPDEIGWYGVVTKLPDRRSYIIEDIIIYPQTVTGATCEQDDDKMFDWEMSLTTEQVNKKRMQGHSHVRMGVTPSSVDEQFYQDLLAQVRDYFIIMITNKSNDYTTRFYDVENGILYSDFDLIVITNTGEAISSWYEVQKKKVDKHIPKTTTLKSKYSTTKTTKRKPRTSQGAWSNTALYSKGSVDALDHMSDEEWEKYYTEGYGGY